MLIMDCLVFTVIFVFVVVLQFVLAVLHWLLISSLISTGMNSHLQAGTLSMRSTQSSVDRCSEY